MNRKETISVVEEYIKDDSAHYAIMITGPWGCGKTHLYKNYLIDAINGHEIGKSNRRYNVYISLYGISTIEDLSKELLIKFFSVKASKGENDSNTAIIAVDGIFSIVSKSVSFQFMSQSKAVTFDFSKLYEKIQKIIKEKNLVICFDDLERCSIPINMLFGMINNLVEQCNCKVIILADEQNIGKMYANTNVESKYQAVLMGGRKVTNSTNDKNDKNNLNGNIEEISIKELKALNEQVFSESFLYRDIKEKIIGETIYYSQSPEETLADLLEMPQ
ncbi:P-loop NTPase fold protein [Butyrivibrio sp. AE2032]|uniref:P-loop NTPase fold protein n=1 Tax=Butyrivibrio sp. AE2032 TaxID=1458463 RepID=UPI000558D83D|nr:P-loop NTPase fold protein [Butyrivibrio sp. AE2032]